MQWRWRTFEKSDGEIQIAIGGHVRRHDNPGAFPVPTRSVAMGRVGRPGLTWP
jgi:hypothetical protein